jgi:hypothetical protein
MISYLHMDDFLPECSNVSYPLLRTINSEFNDNQGEKIRPPDPFDIVEFPTLIFFYNAMKTDDNLKVIQNLNNLHRKKQRPSVKFYSANKKRSRPEFDLQSIVAICSCSLVQGEYFHILCNIIKI